VFHLSLLGNRIYYSKGEGPGLSVEALCLNTAADLPDGDSIVRVRVSLRLAVYRQSVHLGDKPLETHDKQYLFS
jgi:hypothetical protein